MIHHTKLEQKFEDVVVLGDHDALATSDDRNAHEAMKFIDVFHTKHPRDQHLDLVDVN